MVTIMRLTMMRVTIMTNMVILVRIDVWSQ